MRVLLADNSVLISERLQEMLSIYKHVEIAGSFKNGTETLKALRILKPNHAIVDIKISILSGLEVLVEIRNEDKTVKFIIHSFQSADYFSQMAIQSSTIFYLIKLMILIKYRWFMKEWFGKRRMIMESKWPASDMLLIIK